MQKNKLFYRKNAKKNLVNMIRKGYRMITTNNMKSIHDFQNNTEKNIYARNSYSEVM